MTLRVGLMGFGRLGRSIFRILHNRDDIDVVVISDIADHENLAYLLRYDTILGRFPHQVSIANDQLFARGKPTTMLSGKEPGDVDWRAHNVDIVIEATRKHMPYATLSKHIDAGAKRLLLCVAPTDKADVTVVMGVNNDDLKDEHKIISNASITAHCATPIAKVIDQAFGIERLYITSVHAYTNDQSLSDVPSYEMRRSRAASENIIPSQTATAKILMDVLPQLQNKVSAMTLNVPVINGSLIDMVAYTQNKITKESINAAIESAADSDFKDLIEYSTDPIVSSDVKQSPHSSVFDSLATVTMGNKLVKMIAWYDNGWGYANRVVDLMEHLQTKGMVA